MCPVEDILVNVSLALPFWVLLSTIWSKASDFSRKNIQTCAEGAQDPLNPLTLVGGGSVYDYGHRCIISFILKRSIDNRDLSAAIDLHRNVSIYFPYLQEPQSKLKFSQ